MNNSPLVRQFLFQVEVCLERFGRYGHMQTVGKLYTNIVYNCQMRIKIKNCPAARVP